MIRMIQRRLIIPRGDTGSFSIPYLKAINPGDVAVFTIFDIRTKTKMYQKLIAAEGDILNIAFTHGDTVNLKPGKYLWDIKFYTNPRIVDDELVDGDEVDSYYAGFSLPECEIRETGDALLTSDDAPTSTISPESLNIINAAINEILITKKAAVDAAETASLKADAAAESAEDASNSASAASQSAALAEARVNEIENLSVEVDTGLEGTDASATYTPSTGVLSFIIPRGNTGNGIASCVLNNDFTLTINYTNGTSTTTIPIRGDTPHLTIGEVTEGPHAIATITGTDANPILNLTLPNANVPTKLSQLTDDIGVAGKANSADLAAVATSGSYTDLGNKPYIPVKTSDLTNDSNYAVDSNYVHTDNNYTTAEKNKLSGIAAGAEVNVNADWNANSGDAQILNKPTKVSDFTNDAGYLTQHQDLSDYVKNTDYATNNVGGVVKVAGEAYGVLINNNGLLYTAKATDSQIASGTNNYKPIVPNTQHISTFYGLAKVAGDISQLQSSNAVGTYTNEAKVAIQTMLDVPSNADIPTQVSELTNDAGYLTTETDPTVPAWAKAANKPTYTAAEVGAPTVAEMQQAIANVNTMKIHICTVTEYNSETGVPTIANPDAETFYLVPGGDGNNLFIEWAYVNGAWERFGSADVNLSNYVQFNNYPTENTAGVVKINPSWGIGMYNGTLLINGASSSDVKSGNNSAKPISTYRQHESTFYGLAKAAGDTTQSQSENTVGTYTVEAKTAIQTMLDVPAKSDIPEVPVTDVQVDGTSVLNGQGIADIPAASANVPGVVKVTSNSGIGFMQAIVNDQLVTTSEIGIIPASNGQIKNQSGSYAPITADKTNRAVFYGLAKAAGDSTQSQSSNSIGTYTSEAKGAIQKMLGVSDLIAPEENSLAASQAYVIGDIFTANGKLYKTTAAIAANAAIITDGANANCIECNMSDNLSDKVAKAEINYAGISQYTYSVKFGGEFSVTTATTSGYSFPYARATTTGIPSKHKLHRVTVNGTEYILSPKLWFKVTTTEFKVYTYLGKLSLYISDTTGVPGTIDNVPFLIFFDINGNSSIDVITQTAGTYTIKIEEMTPTQKELPKSLIYGDNYVPIEKNNSGGTYNGFSIGVNELKNTRGSIALGYTNSLSHQFTKALGEANTITGKYGIAIGVSNTVSGTQSVAIGTRNTASNDCAVAEGEGTTASGPASHSEGYETLASGNLSHAEGFGSMAEAEGAHAEGVFSVASGASSHAEGAYGTASGRASHTEGEGNIAAGASSHAEGLLTIANGAGTHVSGFYNQADTTYDAWTANTSYNVGDKVTYTNYGYECITANSDTTWTAAHWKKINYSSDKAIIVGNGVSDSSRSNAYTLTWTGDGKYAGDVYVKCNNDSTGGIKLATENIIAIQDTQPTSTDTKIWLPETAGTSIQVPTVEEMNTALAGKVGDVQVNGTSIVSSGVANIPICSSSTFGVVKIDANSFGIKINDSGKLYIDTSSTTEMKAGTQAYKPITSATQHISVFYGLAKASGDTTQSASSNAVGIYTDNAKASIKSMLGIVDGSTGTVDVTGTTPTITAVENTRYVCGEVTSLDLTPAASGTCIVRFTSGSTVTVLTLPSTVKFPEWFDPTSLETNTIYEICITDGIYGAVMSWAQ